MKFDGGEITITVQFLCEKFNYDYMEVKIDEVWDKTVQRILLTMPARIEEECQDEEYSIFDGPMSDRIIGRNKQIKRKV